MSDLVMLASKYNAKKHDVVGWLASHKIDGIRAYWDPEEEMLMTRNRKQIFAPSWFTDALPNYALDGELVFTHNGDECGNFQETCSVVKRHTPDERWKNVMYFVFDAPDWPFTFNLVYESLKQAVLAKHVKVLDQVYIKSVEQMKAMHDDYVAKNGEGLIVRDPWVFYERKRSKSMLKIKIWDDSEARIIEHHPGTGKHEGRLGGLICEWADGRNERTFHVGVGFTDEERDNPPPIGSIITFSYFGMTDGGSPRHPKYLRIRGDI